VGRRPQGRINIVISFCSSRLQEGSPQGDNHHDEHAAQSASRVGQQQAFSLTSIGGSASPN